MDIMSYLMGQNSAIKKGMKVEVVTELPTTGETNVIYLVPKQTSGENDVFDEYIYVNNAWELIGSTAIDISGKQDTMQFSTMPTADATTVGKIVQYIGTTTNDYTNGYFYIGVNNSGTYGWSNVDVQKSLPIYVINTSFAIGYTSNSGINLNVDDKTQILNAINDAYQKGYKGLKLCLIGTTGNAITFENRGDNTTSLQNKPNEINFFAMGNTNRHLKQYADNLISYQLYLTLSWSNNIAYSGSTNVFYGLSLSYLAKDNTASYTPTTDYNPATKKYVDDSVATVAPVENYLGKTSLYNTEQTALNLNGLKKGLYVLKHSSSNNTIWLKATYKLSSGATATTQTLEVTLLDDLSHSTLVLNEILLYIDTAVTENSVGTSAGAQIGSLTLVLSDSTRSLSNNFKTIKLKNTGIIIGNDSFEDFGLASKTYVDTAIGGALNGSY